MCVILNQSSQHFYIQLIYNKCLKKFNVKLLPFLHESLLLTGLDGSPDAATRRQRGRGAVDREYRPGLSAGISGAGFQLENSSMASSVSNRLQAESRAPDSQDGRSNIDRLTLL